MNLTTLLTTLFTFILAAEADLKNSSQEYYLQTKVKPGQTGKGHLDGLWIEAWHTGAGLDDAVAVPSKKHAAIGFLNGTNGQSGNVKYQNQVFDLGGDYASIMEPIPNDVFYAAWQPVRINAGSGASDPDSEYGGFFINSTGLQWTLNLDGKPSGLNNNFGGWLVCDWWHGVPQLFFRIPYYDDPAPSSCADVWLCPEYF